MNIGSGDGVVPSSRSMLSYGVTRPQWVNNTIKILLSDYQPDHWIHVALGHDHFTDTKTCLRICYICDGVSHSLRPHPSHKLKMSLVTRRCWICWLCHMITTDLKKVKGFTVSFIQWWSSNLQNEKIRISEWRDPCVVMAFGLVWDITNSCGPFY